MTLDQKPGSPTEGKCIIANNIEDADPINCNPVYHAWTYERYKKRDAKDDSVQLTSARNCVPNGGCVPGTVPKGNDTCTLEDDSRFALDPNSSATIELNLTANNSGSMAYTRLDAEHLGWLERYVAPGNSPPGTPFPSLTIKPKATNVVSMQIVMPQSPYIAEEKQPDHIQQNIEKVKEAIRKTTQKRAEEIERLKSLFIQQGLPRIEVPRKLDADEPVYTPQALRALQSEKNRGYEENCGRRDIDFAGLKHLLRKFVAEREDELFSGQPEISLEQMVLTTSFQIQVDASAGTYHIFRFFPVLIPPTLSLNPDHTHQLKITFKGVKNRGNPRNREALRQKCLTRLQGVVGGASECNSPTSLLLESLIEAVEANKAN